MHDMSRMNIPWEFSETVDPLSCTILSSTASPPYWKAMISACVCVEYAVTDMYIFPHLRSLSEVKSPNFTSVSSATL